MRRYAIVLVLLIAALGSAVVSNEAIMDVLQRGTDRAIVGIQVLQAREDQPGYSAFAERERWREEGVQGWILNPLFGYGPEAFRYRFGITSHSTPIDILYNSGLIGFVLFYSLFPLMMWRVLLAPRNLSDLKAVLTGGLLCYLFISLSGTLHYNAYLAAFVAVGVALLNRHQIESEHDTDAGE